MIARSVTLPNDEVECHNLFVLGVVTMISLMLHACGPSRLEMAQQAGKREMPSAATPTVEGTDVANVARAHRLDAAAMAVVPVVPLTSQESLDEYSSRLDDLKFLVLSAERDALIQSPPSEPRVQAASSLKREKETLASGMITKGKAELAMKDFEAASKTLRRVLIEFDSKVYGGLTRQAEDTLREVEKAAELSQAQGKQ